MRRVVLESPYAGNWWQRHLNRNYARRCLRDCLLRDEAPLASHLLYTQVLKDSMPEQRKLGILANLEWIVVCDALVVYTDRGVTAGMMEAIVAAEAQGTKVEYRALSPAQQLALDDPLWLPQRTDRPREPLDFL